MKIVITDYINIAKETKEKLAKIPNITIYDDTSNDPSVIIDRIKDAEVATANFIDFTDEVIKNAPKLKYIICPTKGYDWINVKTATERGVKVLNCPTFNAQAVAEHAIALMFAVKKLLLQSSKSILEGKYNTQEFVGTEIFEKTLLTIGHGEVGKRILKMAVGLGMKTDFVDSKTEDHLLDEKMSKADVLVLCLTLNDKTKGIINERRISLLKPTSILVNVARGLIIDQVSFYKSLKENKIAGAGIDTFAKDETIKEPTEEILNFAKLPNVVATPHTAYNTIEAAERLGEELIADIKSCLSNSPINVVN